MQTEKYFWFGDGVDNKKCIRILHRTAIKHNYVHAAPRRTAIYLPFKFPLTSEKNFLFS